MDILVFSLCFFMLLSVLWRGNLVFLNIILMKKVVCVYREHTSTWEAPSHFGWCVWRLLVVKKILSLCHWNRLCMLFMLAQRVSAMVRQFVVGGIFFCFFFFSFSSPINYRLILFVVGISTLVFIFFISIFCC